MITVPCPVCGYHAPEPVCPHCGGEPLEPSLRRRRGGPLTGVLDGLLALPRGLQLLSTTPGVKRWLAPPLILTMTLLVVALSWSFSIVGDLLDAALPDGIEIDPTWTWLEGLEWGWLESTWVAIVASVEWIANLAWGLLSSQPLRLLTWFLVGSLVAWYCFSIAYEALAGPFLDEIQARIEKGWFGEDPRSRLERPNDLPPERCARLLTIGAALASVTLLTLLLVPGPPWWIAFLVAPLGLVAPTLRERRYGPWLAWVVRVEWRAIVASLQASVITGLLVVFALPLYFVPIVGYPLFATVCGFATAVGLLDIPLERRGWKLGQRLRFVGRNLLPMLAFGIVSGFLLAVPILGPVLMVPSASIGGLWLVCRLDKASLRDGEPAAGGTARRPG